MLRLLTNPIWSNIIWFVPALIIGIIGYHDNENQALYATSFCWAVFWYAASYIANGIANKDKK